VIAERSLSDESNATAGSNAQLKALLSPLKTSATCLPIIAALLKPSNTFDVFYAKDCTAFNPLSMLFKTVEALPVMLKI